MKSGSILIICMNLVLAAGTLVSAAEAELPGTESRLRVRQAAGYGEATEMHLPTDFATTPWILDPSIFIEDQGDRIEVRQALAEEVKTVKLANQIPPIRFREGEADIPQAYLALLRDLLDSMRERNNVRLHFVGHADSQPLSNALQAVYGDNVGLSRDRAGTTAEYCQQALNLPPEAISYEGVGDRRPIASNATEPGRALNRRVEVEVWYDEISEKPVAVEEILPREVSRVKVCRTETVCKLRYQDGFAHRARVKNLVTPLRYDPDNLGLAQSFLQQIEQAWQNLKGKQNLLVKVIAHTDDRTLSGRQARIYGNQLNFSKAIARRLARAVQEQLALPEASVTSEGRGPAQAAASNDTPKGRALNRRIEVEFWYDDSLQTLPDEPQICPEVAGAEVVTRVYQSPSGEISPILFEQGQPVVPAATVEQLRRVLSEVADKDNVRLRFIGYASNERLSRRTAAIYGDDIGWSTVRAGRAKQLVCNKLGWTEARTEFEGRGYLQSEDLINTGFLGADRARVEVQVVYDELLILDQYEGVEITRLVREVTTENPFALNLMRITVDGQPVDDPGKSIPDVQRCTDLALDRAQVRFKHSSLELNPRLNLTAWPRSVRYRDLEETPFAENRVDFRLYTNYRSFIERAEVRIFDQQQSVRETPLAIRALDSDGLASWLPDFEGYTAPGRALKYLVRVYDAAGRYDETVPQPLWLIDQVDPVVVAATPARELLAGYGGSRIARQNIPLHGGTIQTQGKAVPDGHSVWLAGHAVPVDGQGNFIAEEILPEGLHTVEVAILDKAGNGNLFLRDLAMRESDWFSVGIVDQTLSGNSTNGPARLLSPDNARYSEDLSLQGRLAFYSSGKFANGWSLTASADTKEGPLDEIFSNFLDKSSSAQFRRLDPDRHYPTFGDDSTLEETAPTSGKLYLKMNKDQNFGLWGNFRVKYLENELAQVDRDLYGSNLHYQSLETTGFGEPRLLLDGFAADPGTVAERDEFRGSGGSLFYLRQQDILQGSENIRIEVRDKDSGIVLGVKQLTPELDYDIDYLQGRILLTAALPTTANDNLLVASDGLSGHPVFLVVRYEFSPGFVDPHTWVSGGRAHYWLNDYLRFGLTANWEQETGDESNLGGFDLTLRKSPASWLKLEVGRSRGPGVVTSSSDDGGYSFDVPDPVGNSKVEATAYRFDGSVAHEEVIAGWRGRSTFYLQNLAKGYSGPGQLTSKETTRYGGTLEMPFGEQWQSQLKLDRQVQPQGLETEAGEVNLDYQMNRSWTLSSGLRIDSREDNSADLPATQEEGKRIDAVARVTYNSLARWRAYGFAQQTLEVTGDREDNARFGIGGSWRLTDRFKLLGEVSEGDLGSAASLGSEFLYSDRTTIYANYTLENERSDNGLLSRKGNLASGFRSRYSDGLSLYLEEQYTHGDVPTGLVHSAGVDLSPTDRLNLGANIDVGTLKDPDTAAELERTAVAFSAGYGFERLSLASGLEYRVDNSEQSDGSFAERTTWLFKNSFRFQLSPDWRVVGKFNYSQSESSLGEAFDGDYTEAILGYAYRPVRFDRLNVLLKYTYFQNLPASDEAAASETSFIQHSHIGAIDLSYDLTPRITLGGKYAYRFGRVAQERENPEFFDSRAQLVVLRADWHMLHRWDALVEARLLDLPDAQDRRSGALLALYRHLGNHLKVGGGYNFSDFSDDLTQLDYRHQGLFINMIGKF